MTTRDIPSFLPIPLKYVLKILSIVFMIQIQNLNGFPQARGVVRMNEYRSATMFLSKNISSNNSNSLDNMGTIYLSLSTDEQVNFLSFSFHKWILLCGIFSGSGIEGSIKRRECSRCQSDSRIHIQAIRSRKSNSIKR